MWLVALEACFAFCVFAFIVWWTMFSGRKPDQMPPGKSLPPKEPRNDK